MNHEKQLDQDLSDMFGEIRRENVKAAADVSAAKSEKSLSERLTKSPLDEVKAIIEAKKKTAQAQIEEHKVRRELRKMAVQEQQMVLSLTKEQE